MRVLSSGQRTMQSWHSQSLVPEGIECHMVPLTSGASPEGDVCFCLLTPYACTFMCMRGRAPKGVLTRNMYIEVLGVYLL